jgi:hypothetical protein
VKALPVVTGVLVLGFALVLFLSSVRPTRSHVYRWADGEPAFALDVPRSWTEMKTSGGSSVTLEGPLPSGRKGLLSIQGFTRPLRAAKEPHPRSMENGITREVWADDGWTRSLESGRLLGRDAGIWQLDGTVQRHDASFNFIASFQDPPLEGDLTLLERCFRSIRWIGR